jgi:hypothetical protein
MKYFIISILLVNSFSVFSTDFKIRSYKLNGTLQLSMMPKGGESIDNIVNSISVPYRDFNIRLIGLSSKKTNLELEQFYKKEFGLEFHLIKHSDIKSVFIKAFESTSLYLNLTQRLKVEGFNCQVNHIEKIGYKIKGQEGAISIPDVWLKCIK